VDTIRSAIRYDIRYRGADGDGNPVLDSPSNAFVQLVIGMPKDGVLSTTMVGLMVKGFLASIFASGTEATFDSLKAALDSSYLIRILNGEA